MLRTAGVIVAAGLALTTGLASADDTVWTQVGTGIQQGISGITTAGDGGWVVVRDNKLDGQNRVALLSADNVITDVTWPGTPPRDLESIDAVPDQPGRYAVVTSAGAGTLISVTGTSVVPLRSFTLPVGRNQSEAFALTKLGSTVVAVWGNRGSSTNPGHLFAATFDPATGAFGRSVRAAVTVPYPTTAVRHIADAEVLGGRIVISSTSDPGTSGPFASALYDVGSVYLAAGRARLAVASPTSLGIYDGHKIEGVACAGSAGLLASDDEKLGASVAPASFCA